MDTRIAVASQSFGARFQTLVYGHLRRALQAGESIDECQIVRPREADFLRTHLLTVLKASPRPLALICICLRPDPETVAEYRAAGVPVVLIDEEVEGASTVSCDNRAGGYIAGKHLARSGRKSIAVVAGPDHHYNAALRLSGVTKALEEHRLALPPEAVIESPTYVRKEGEAAMARLLRERPKLDAVFSAAGDTCALGVLSVAKEAGLKVPEQLAIVGYDDIPLASISDPPLTTIRQPLDTLAREAHRLATQCTEEILASPKQIVIEPVLVPRSTG
jgi:DNA-binding LacI/PurR family transcriptional regulator